MVAEVLLFQRPADAVAVEAAAVLVDDGGQPAGGLPAQILVLRTLHHAEQRLRTASPAAAARQPAVFRRHRTAQSWVRCTDSSW